MSLAPGFVLLDKYRIEATIGEGAFAQVYRATHVALNAPRALKVLRRDAPGVGSTEFSDFRQRFQMEAQIGARLDHPHVARVYDFEQDGETLALVMEYAAGGSLADRLAQAKQAGQPLPIAEVVRIAREVAEGLTAMHALDTVHRDLKPSNILFDAQGSAKVADLGLAQIPGGPSQRSLGSLAPPHPGTPGYMSPEQTETRGYLTPASDVFALGAILFEMLTGRAYKNVRPETRLATLRADVPAWLDDLVARMVAPTVEARPWDGAEVVRLLAQGGSARRTLGRRAKWAAMGIGLLLIIGLGIGVTLWQGSQPTMTSHPPTMAPALTLPTETPTKTPPVMPSDTPIPTVDVEATAGADATYIARAVAATHAAETAAAPRPTRTPRNTPRPTVDVAATADAEAARIDQAVATTHAAETSAAPAPGLVTSCDSPQRIKFEPGGTSATVPVTNARARRNCFVLGAAAGQTMTAHAVNADGRAILVVWGADGSTMQTDQASSPDFEAQLPSTQDYYILVAVGQETGYYALQVTIPPLPRSSSNPTAPKRITFQRGAISATFTVNLAANVPQYYVLGALAGQTLIVDTDTSISVQVFGPRNSALSPTAGGDVHWEYPLPSTGDYTIVITGQGLTTVTLTIPPR